MTATAVAPIPQPGRRPSLNPWFRLLVIETRRSVALWFVPVMVALGLYISAGDPYADGLRLWGELQTNLGFVMVVMVPVAGAVAAWTAGRERRRGIEDALRVLPSPSAPRDLAAWAATTAWCVAAYLVVAAVRIVETARDATWGIPDPVGIAVGVGCVVAAAAFGHLVGALVPSRLAAVLAAGLLSLGMNLYDRVSSDIESEPFRYLSPWTYLYSFGFDFGWIQPKYGGGLVLWLGGVAAALFAAASVWRTRSRASWAALAATLAIAVLGAGASIWFGPRDNGWVPAATPVCRDTTIPVCVHPAYEKYLDETAAVVGAVVAPVAGLPGAPTRAADFGSERDASSADTLQIGNYLQGNDPDFVAAEIALDLVADEFSGGIRVYGADQPNAVQIAVARWLVAEAGYDPDATGDWLLPACMHLEAESAAAYETTRGMGEGWQPPDLTSCQAPVRDAIDRFARIPPDQRRAWLEANFADLRAGRLTVEDLP
jgi:hypothetical protein